MAFQKINTLKNILCVDLFPLYYKYKPENNFNSLEQAYTKDIIKTIVKHIYDEIIELQNNLHCSNVIVLSDLNSNSKLLNLKNTSGNYRLNIDPKYKANRYKTSGKKFSNLINVIKYIEHICRNTENWIYMSGAEYEADDIAAYIILNKQQGYRYYIVTTDSDWYKLVDDVNYITWKNSKTQEIDLWDKKILSEKLGFNVTYNSIIEYKAIFGDVADNINLSYDKTKITHKELLEKFKNNDFTINDYLIKSIYTNNKILISPLEINENKLYIIKGSKSNINFESLLKV